MKTILWLATLCLWLAFATNGLAETKAAKGARPAASGGRTTAAPDQPQPSLRRWSAYVTVSTVFDSNIDHDEDNRRAFGLVYGLGAHFQNRASRPSFALDYEVADHRYRATDKWNRLSHNLRATFDKALSQRWSLETRGEVSLKGSSEDRELSNQFIVLQEVKYRLTRRDRLTVFGAYRLKRYDEEAGRDSNNPYGGLKLLHRFGDGRNLEFAYRYEKNRARESRNRYIRWTYSAEFETPIVGRDRLTFEAKYRPQKYERLVEVDDEEVPRRDRRWVFEVDYAFWFSRHLEVRPSYKFETRSSNDPDKFFDAHLAGVTLTYHW